MTATDLFGIDLDGIATDGSGSFDLVLFDEDAVAAAPVSAATAHNGCGVVRPATPTGGGRASSPVGRTDPPTGAGTWVGTTTDPPGEGFRDRAGPVGGAGSGRPTEAGEAPMEASAAAEEEDGGPPPPPSPAIPPPPSRASGDAGGGTAPETPPPSSTEGDERRADDKPDPAEDSSGVVVAGPSTEARAPPSSPAAPHGSRAGTDPDARAVVGTPSTTIGAAEAADSPKAAASPAEASSTAPSSSSPPFHHAAPPPGTIPYEGTGGCQTCKADDDHANLLLCERCNDEYHTYCLDPPLRSVPDGDFFCDKCKPFYEKEDSDGLSALVNALPPAYTSRFGEIVWAAGGVGFGWWPAAIYDPRLTVGSARQLARKNLGRKHLVYFFECHDAPFTVLTNGKIATWEDGLLEEYDLGKTAKANGKAKELMFEQALQLAIAEHCKPVEMRLEFNHDRPEATPGHVRKRHGGKNDEDVAVAPPMPAGKRDPFPSPGGPTKRKRGRPSKSSLASRPATSSSTVPPDDRPSKAEARALAAALALSRAEAAAADAKRKRPKAAQRRLTNRGNFSAAVRSLTPNEIEPAIEEEEEGELFVKLLLRLPPPCASAAAPGADHGVANVGFVTLPSRRTSTFADARLATERQLDDDMPLPPPLRWKFYVPGLGPVSRKQEGRLGPLMAFLRSVSSPAGDGTSRSPLAVHMVEGTLGLFGWPGVVPPPHCSSTMAMGPSSGNAATSLSSMK